ncbi:MAG TPA: substrate-binding domain-containing protein, partial [Planctomycetota bacterium]
PWTMRPMSLARIGVVLLGLTALAACGGDDEGEPGRLRIAVVPKGTTHEFWKAIHAGALEAGEEFGAEILWKGPLREDDRSAQVQVIENFVIRGIDGLVLAPMDDTALVAPAREAAAAGIPVVVVDSDLQWDGRISFIATDNYLGGVLAARDLAARLAGTEGRVILMRYQEGSASTMKREAGFLDTLEKEFPQLTVLSSNQHAGATVEGAYQTAENLLLNHADVDGVFCPNESAAFGMLRALQDSGRAGKVRFVGFDPSERMVAALQAGEMDAIVVQDPVAMGRMGVRTIVLHLQGKKVASRIDTGVTLVTRDNMSQPEVAALLAPDLSILGD